MTSSSLLLELSISYCYYHGFQPVYIMDKFFLMFAYITLLHISDNNHPIKSQSKE